MFSHYFSRCTGCLICIILLILFTTFSGCVESDVSYAPDESPLTLSPSEEVGLGSGQVTRFVSQIPFTEEIRPSPTPSTPIQRLTKDTMQVYRWYYNTAYYTWTISVPTDRYNYFAELPRDKNHPVDYVMSDRGRSELHQVMDQFITLAGRYKLSNDEHRDLIISFVQSLPNNRWGSVRDYDDYPKYPLQTLYDGGGDSQDTTILLTALLRLLGLPASILEMPNHYAVLLPQTENDKITGKVYVYLHDDGRVMKGNYLDENDVIQDFYPDNKDIARKSYTYIESNIPGYPIGTIPTQLRSSLLMTMRDMPLHLRRDTIDNASIVHPKQYPDADLNFNARLIHLDQRYAYYQVYCTITSGGTGPARDLRVSMIAQPAMSGDWRYAEQKTVSEIPEGATRLVEGTVQVPRNAAAEIECIMSGPGISEVKRVSQVFFT
jgi:transglutaminase-like putative cysteine protease